MRDEVKIHGTRKKETVKAVLWRVEKETEDGTEYEDVWFPLSQVHSIHPDHIVVTRWIADKKGLL